MPKILPKSLLQLFVDIEFTGSTMEFDQKFSTYPTAQKMKFSINNFFSKCDQIHSFLKKSEEFTEEILDGKLHFLCSVLSEEYSVTSQTSKIEHFAKRLSVFSYFCICLTGF